MPRTVADLTSRYDGRLLPPLPAGPGVCSVCATSVAGSDLLCWQCSRHRALPARADAVAAVALAVKHGPFAYELGAYKSGADVFANRRLQRALAAVLWRWLAGHERCLARAAGLAAHRRGTRFEVVTVVPSQRGRTGHPLRDMVGRQVAPTADRYQDLLVGAAPTGPVRAAPTGPVRAAPTGPVRAAPTGPLGGRSVLLIDDTWTTGAHAQHAACALKLAGAGPVAVLALGRHFSLGQPAAHGAAARSYLARAERRGWSWQHCRRC